VVIQPITEAIHECAGAAYNWTEFHWVFMHLQCHPESMFFKSSSEVYALCFSHRGSMLDGKEEYSILELSILAFDFIS